MGDLEKNVKNAFDKDSFVEDSNKVWVVAKLLGIEEAGFYGGSDKNIVLAKTSRGDNKDQYVWVVLSKEEEMTKLVINESLVFIEGYMSTSYVFNSRAVSHTFIVPDNINRLEGEVELEKKDDFYLNYTMNNRVVLEGVIDKEPWREFIPPANNYVTRFSIKYKENGKSRSMYCTVWDTVNDVKDLSKGKKVKVIGSFNLLKKSRGLQVKDGYVTEVKKNKLDSYVIVVQRIELLDSGLVKIDEPE